MLSTLSICSAGFFFSGLIVPAVVPHGAHGRQQLLEVTRRAPCNPHGRGEGEAVADEILRLQGREGAVEAGEVKELVGQGEKVEDECEERRWEAVEDGCCGVVHLRVACVSCSGTFLACAR